MPLQTRSSSPPKVPIGEAGEAGGTNSGEELVREIGARVREARKAAKLSRRVLSEKSQVSQRFIAQLENGGGNISILVLKRIADALDLVLAELVADTQVMNADMAEFVTRFGQAGPDVRRQVMSILSGDVQANSRDRRIALIGLRGAGKSTLGAKLGEMLDLPFVELNRRIEEQAGMPLNDLIALYGPDGFRGLEHDCLKRLSHEAGPMVLEVAGGIVSDSQSYALLLENFRTIWVRASPQEHMDRVRAQGDERPMAGNPQAMNQLRTILARRETDYARADHVVDTSGRETDACLKELVRIIQPIEKS